MQKAPLVFRPLSGDISAYHEPGISSRSCEDIGGKAVYLEGVLLGFQSTRITGINTNKIPKGRFLYLCVLEPMLQEERFSLLGRFEMAYE